VTSGLSACGSTTEHSAGDERLTTVTLALDYLANNAGFAGFYVAQQNGYYKSVGLDVKIQPYTDTTADVLVSAGQADFGTVDSPTLIMDRAAGQNLVAIMAMMQHAAFKVAVATKDTDKIHSPKDLQGKTFGGFGVPIEQGINNAMIKADGGATPDYRTVTLGPSVYDALTAGQVDWALIYDTDDIAWARLRGDDWKTLNPQQYGVPDYYEKMIFSTDDYLSSHQDVAKKFAKASAEGFDWAAHHPAEATSIQASLVKGDFDLPNQTETATLLARNYWLGSNGKVGHMDAALWNDTARFLFEQGLLKDAQGGALSEAPNTSTYFTNEYLPEGTS